MTEEKLITADMTIKEVLEKYPQALDVFFEFELYCAGCPMAQQESLKQGAETHGIDLEKFLDRLNEASQQGV